MLSKYTQKRTIVHNFQVFLGEACPRTPPSKAWLRDMQIYQVEKYSSPLPHLSNDLMM